MRRLRGLPNEHYQKRKAAITKALKTAFGDCLSEPVPDDAKPDEMK